LTVVHSDDSESGFTIASELRQILEPPYVRAFSGYDHFAPLSISGCAPGALGVGLFDPAQAPRKLQFLQFESGRYTTREMATDFDVVTFAPIVRDEEKDAVVGIIGRTGTGSVFAVAQITNCTSASLVAETQVVFDWKTPRAPLFSGPMAPDPTVTVPKTNGVRLIPVAVEKDVFEYEHYDGFDVRVFRVTSAPSWQITETKYPIHADRTDLAFE